MTAETAERMPGTRPAGPGGGPEEEWSLRERFMLRVAGLPIEAVQGLRCPGSSRWAEEVLAEEERLGSRGAAISDRLHPLVAQVDDDGLRRGLIRLRRNVFNGRPADDPAVLAALRSAPHAGLADDVVRWEEQRAALAQLRARGPAVLAADLVLARTELRRLAGDERLRRGLQLASPVLAGQLDAFVRHDPARPPDKRRRKVERSLLAYVYRMACKTSPFSTFTAVAAGRFTPEPAPEAAEAHVVRVADEWSSHPRLNVVALSRLADLILADAERRGDLPVRLASGWGEDDDRIRYVRRSVMLGDDTAAVTLDTARDRVFFLRRSGTLDRLQRLFGERPSVRYGEISDWLCRDQRAEPEEAGRYLSALVQLGMVQVPCLSVDVHSPDPARDFQAALRALDRDWARRLADALDGPVSCLDRYAGADAAERGRLLAELRAGLQAIQRELGDETATLPQTILYEDVRAGGGSVSHRLPKEPADGAGPHRSLRVLERALQAFDRTIAHRITFKGFFLARYGAGSRCDDVLKLVHDFREDFYDQYLTVSNRRKAFDAEGAYVPEADWLHLPGIAALDEARRTFTGELRRLWQEHGGEAEVRLGEEALAAVADRLGEVAHVFSPRTHFVQPVHREDDPHLVLNQSYGGLSFPFSRFTHCFDGPAAGPDGDLSDLLRSAAATARPAGAVLAELTGGFATTNLNLHGRLAEYEIVCTGETSSAPADRQLPVEDLCLEHDPVADRLVLRSKRLDREVVPVYFGYLAPQMLPEIPQTLLLLSPTWMIPLDVWGGVPEGPARDGVTVRPRIRCGDVVLSRRTWKGPVSVLPLRTPGTTDDAWFLGWQRWRRTHGVPARVYVTVGAAGGRGAAARATRGKPQYVDFDSPLALAVLENLFASPEDLVHLQEALPDEDDLITRSGRGSHVAELVLETLTVRRPGGAPTSPAPAGIPSEAVE